MTYPEIRTRTVQQRGIYLPWSYTHREVVGVRPNVQIVDGKTDTGTVFIPMQTLYNLAEQDVFDSQFGDAFLLGWHEGLALGQAGLAVEETRGGFHRSDLLLEWLRSIREIDPEET